MPKPGRPTTTRNGTLVGLNIRLTKAQKRFIKRKGVTPAQLRACIGAYLLAQFPDEAPAVPKPKIPKDITTTFTYLAPIDEETMETTEQ